MENSSDRLDEIIKEQNEEIERRQTQKELLLRIKTEIACENAWGNISPKNAFLLLCSVIEKYADYNNLCRKDLEAVNERLEFFKKAEPSYEIEMEE